MIRGLSPRPRGAPAFGRLSQRLRARIPGLSGAHSPEEGSPIARASLARAPSPRSPFQAGTSRSECPATKGHAENSSRSLPRARVQFPGGELSSVQSSPVGQSCPTLRPHGLQPVRFLCPSPTPSACSGSVHQVGDAIQPPHPLSSPFPPAFSLSQHQGVFK